MTQGISNWKAVENVTKNAGQLANKTNKLEKFSIWERMGLKRESFVCLWPSGCVITISRSPTVAFPRRYEPPQTTDICIQKHSWDEVFVSLLHIQESVGFL